MKKLIAIVAVAILVAVSAVTFASTSGTSSVSISAGGVSGDLASVTAAGSATSFLKYGTYTAGSTTKYRNPAWSPVANSAGSISTTGDLYSVDTTGNTGNVLVTIYLDNPNALAKNYTYLNLKVNIWKKGASYVAPTVGSAGTNGWEQATLSGGTAIGTVYLTMSNGYTSFILAGDAEYDITVDGGSYFCISTDTSGGGSLSPSFYVTVDTA